MTQTGHPEELLAEYVDGTLDERDRRAVDAHLATCAVCREDVGLAGGARQILHRLPEEPVPVGVTRPLVDEVSARRSRPERTPWGQRIQWAAGIAAAAALVAVVAISLPDLGGGTADRGGGGDGAAAPAEAGIEATSAPQSRERFAFAVSLESSNRDFGDRALRGLATEVVRAVRDDSLEPPSSGGSPEETRQALGCVTSWAGPTEEDVLVRLIRATYGGEPAYVAVYLRGPGVGDPPTRATVWVVSADGSCEFLDITESTI